jgi:glycosyltransferase involved in cell wall biosynthesis
VRLLVDARVGWGHGIGRVIANTLPRVAALRPDWQVSALVEPADVAQAQAAFAAADTVRVVPCPVRPFSLAEQVRLAPFARGHDLTWFTNYWVPLAWRGPFVATVHDLLHLLPDLLPASAAKRQLARRTFAKVRRDARAVAFVSRFSEREFARLVGAPRRGVAIPLGGDHLRYPAPRPVRDRTRRLLVVAASKQHKNFALLMDAWRHAAVPAHWTLTVVTPDDARFRSAIDLDAVAGGTGRVEIRRGVGNDELAALYGDSAILLMPSRYEGFGLPLLEGMLAGALPVCSAAGAMVEVAGGALVPFVNADDRPGWSAAIAAACAMVDAPGTGPDPDALVAHNRAQAARFRWDDTAQAYAALLQAALA